MPGPVSWVRRRVGEYDPPEPIEDEVAAELQYVLTPVWLLHAIAAKHPAQIAPEDLRPEERSPSGPLEAEGAISGEFRIAHDGHVPGTPRQVERQHLRFRLRDDEDGTPRGREFVASGIHLAEVGVAGDSGQVPEEDQQKKLAIQKRRQPDGSPIRPQEGEVGQRCRRGSLLDLFQPEGSHGSNSIVSSTESGSALPSRTPTRSRSESPRTRPECAPSPPAAVGNRAPGRATRSTAPYRPTLASHASRDTARTGSAGRRREPTPPTVAGREPAASAIAGA